MFHFIVVEMVRRSSIFLDIYGFRYSKLVAAVFAFPLMCWYYSWKPLVISPIVFSCVLYGCLKHFKILRVKVNIFVIIWPFLEFTLTSEHFLSGAKTCWAMSCPDVLQIGRKCIAFNIRWYCEKFRRRIQE